MHAFRGLKRFKEEKKRENGWEERKRKNKVGRGGGKRRGKERMFQVGKKTPNKPFTNCQKVLFTDVVHKTDNLLQERVLPA